jgi:hypothetical protein
VSFRRQVNTKRCALLAQRRKQRASNQYGPFDSLNATRATKRNFNAIFGSFDATQTRQRLRPKSLKKDCRPIAPQTFGLVAFIQKDDMAKPNFAK